MERNRLLIALAAVLGIAVGSLGTLAVQQLRANRPSVADLITSTSSQVSASPVIGTGAAPSAAPSHLANPSPPSNRVRPGAADDPLQQQQVVMFGGAADMSGSGPTNDTWTWDGSSWTQAHPGHSPSARYGAAMAFDADRQLVVLFGGTGPKGPLNDTWTWDGADWQQLTPATMPPAMSDPTMTYYPPKHEIVMYFFSEAQPGAPANDIWTWNGTTWSDAGSATTPLDLSGAPSKMAYLESTKTLYRVGHSGGASVMVAFDGNTWTSAGVGPGSVDFTLSPDQAGSALVSLSSGSGTFLWNGTGWWGWAGPTPTFRRGTATVYDSTRKAVVLFSGDISGLDMWTFTSKDGWSKAPA